MPKCRTCQAEIIWITMEESGKAHPVNPKPVQMVLATGEDDRTKRGRVVSVYESHFATCPQADEHRKS
jgi:hypothetical protein